MCAFGKCEEPVYRRRRPDLALADLETFLTGTQRIDTTSTADCNRHQPRSGRRQCIARPGLTCEDGTIPNSFLQHETCKHPLWANLCTSGPVSAKQTGEQPVLVPAGYDACVGVLCGAQCEFDFSAHATADIRSIAGSLKNAAQSVGGYACQWSCLTMTL